MSEVGPFAVAADHNPVGFHQVRYRAALAKEFRIADHIEFRAGLIVAANRVRHLFACFYGNRAFIDNDAVFLEHRRNFTGDTFDIGEIHAAIRLRGRGNRDENNLGSVHALFD